MSKNDRYVKGLEEAVSIARQFAPHAHGNAAQATAHSIADICQQRANELRDKKLLKRNEQFIDGARWGIKIAIAWLHSRAGEMKDNNAVLVLNSAAHNLGQDKKAILEDIK